MRDKLTEIENALIHSSVQHCDNFIRTLVDSMHMGYIRPEYYDVCVLYAAICIAHSLRPLFNISMKKGMHMKNPYYSLDDITSKVYPKESIQSSVSGMSERDMISTFGHEVTGQHTNHISAGIFVSVSLSAKPAIMNVMLLQTCTLFWVKPQYPALNIVL